MSSRHKNKGKHNNPKGGQSLTRDERSLKDLLKDFAKDWEGRQKELVTKHNEMAAQLAAQEQLTRNVANFAAAEFGKMQAKLNIYFQSVDGALHHHDVNDIATSEMLREIFGQLTQADLYFRRIQGLDVSLSDDEVEGIKKEAVEWFSTTMTSAFKTANETVERQRKEAEEARQQEKAAIAAEKEKAASDRAEAERMEAELLKAEQQDRGVAQASGHTEAESLGLPPDVRVFGMT